LDTNPRLALLAWVLLKSPKDIAPVLSLLVTIISTVHSKLGFERKWVANRLTHSALRLLKIDEKTGANAPDIAVKFKAILQKHDEIITATSSG
jgi:hypothetical protein